MNYIAIDNGVTGALALITEEGDSFITKTPTIKSRSYTKEVKYITRVNYPKLVALLRDYIGKSKDGYITVVMERAMIMPGRFVATLSAIRALEATQIALEEVGLKYSFIDSKEWQKVMLPPGTKGEALKTESLRVGKELFPGLASKIKKDADSLLIAEYTRRKNHPPQK